MNAHAVDVLIPTYNPNPAHLVEALKGLLSQTFSDWQALIHDDCSDGDTESMVRPFLSDPRITFKRSPVRLGIGGNWNACLHTTRAPFIAYLFQDDVWTADYLSHAMHILDSNLTVGFVSMAHRYLFDGFSPSAYYYERAHAVMQQLKPGLHRGQEMLRWMLNRELNPNVIGEPSFVVIRRYIIEAAGPFLTDMPQALDMEEWLRVLRITNWYYASEGEFGSFRVHRDGTSAVNQEAGHGLPDRLRCFEILLRNLCGEERRLALKARDKAIGQMIAKFCARVSDGNAISVASRRNLMRYCLQHPLLLAKSMLMLLCK